MNIRNYLAAAAVIAAAILYGRKMMTVERLQGEIDRLSVELSHAQVPLQRDTIRDSIEVVPTALAARRGR